MRRDISCLLEFICVRDILHTHRFLVLHTHRFLVLLKKRNLGFLDDKMLGFIDGKIALMAIWSWNSS